jgi:trehalose utilization protein
MGEEHDMRITIWNEGVHEQTDATVASVYPKGIHGAIAEGLAGHPLLSGAVLRTATLADPACGLTEEVLEDTDVLFWWGHMAHDEVPDEVARRVARHVLRGMGLVALHSAHFSKPFMALMGTSCTLKWRDDDRERLWTVLPGHPIAAGLPEHFELPAEEMYGEPFDVPEPDETVFISWFAGGEVFRSGCVFRRGLGRIFYFRPGHEMHPTYYDANIVKVLGNAAAYVNPVVRGPEPACPNVPALEASRSLR